MSKKKQHLDDFLRNKLSELENAPVAGFEKVETRMAAKSHRGIVLALLIPFIAMGLYWMTSFTERDLIEPGNPEHQHTTSPSMQGDEPANLEYRTPKLEVESPKVEVSKEANQLVVTSPEPVHQSEVNQPEPSSQLAIKNNRPDGVLEIAPLNPPQILVESGDALQRESDKITRINELANQMNLVPAYYEPAISTNQSAAMISDQERLVTIDESATAQQTGNVSVSTSTVVPIYSSPRPWEITVNFYPNYTFRDFKINSDYRSMVHPRYEEIVSTSEKGGFGFNIGLAAKYHLGNNVYIGSGIGYIENKVNGRYTYNIYQEIPVYNDDPPIRVEKTEEHGAYQAIPVDQGIIQTYRYVQIPLHISYQPWATNRLRIIVEGGFSYLRFISAEGTTVDFQTLVPTDLSNLNYTKDLGSFDFKVGVMYYASKQVAFGVEPTMMYFNQSIFKEDHPLSVVPWSVGINFNVRMRLY